MKRLLISCFEPFGSWIENASQLAVELFVHGYSGPSELVVRHYPVDFDQLEQRLDRDLRLAPDAIIFTGQSARAAAVELEAVALNVRGDSEQSTGPFSRLVDGAPTAYETALPLDKWCQQLAGKSIPAVISHHAGTFLCNALLFHTLHRQQTRGTAPAMFVHLPLTPNQSPGPKPGGATLPTEDSATAIHEMVTAMERPGRDAIQRGQPLWLLNEVTRPTLP